jgi:hypothetical protein
MNRNLDDIYFRIERNGKYENVCFSDMTESEQREVLKDKPIRFVTEVALEVNEEGDDVLYVSYLQDGEEKSAYTNNTVYNANKSSLTAGDIVKVKTTDGIITSLNSYVGLAEDIFK